MNESSLNYQKEAILGLNLRKFFKGNEYVIDTFGLYNTRRKGNADDLKHEIKGFLEPKSLSRIHPNWSWELTNSNKRMLEFRGKSSTNASMKLVFQAITSEIDDSVEDLQMFFNLLKVPLPRKYRKKLEKRKDLVELHSRTAKANVEPIRQRSQFTCVSTSTCMALNALGVKCDEDEINRVIGAKALQGARWEEVLACAQYYGCRATLTCPATLTQVKEWTDQGKPVLIAWNPEGRDWSHASLIFDVVGEKGSYVVHVADPNMPNPDKTTREVSEDEFYSKWYEKWPNYLVRRPALMIEREVCQNGRQLMASSNSSFIGTITKRRNKMSRLAKKIANIYLSNTQPLRLQPDYGERNAADFLGERSVAMNMGYGDRLRPGPGNAFDDEIVADEVEGIEIVDDIGLDRMSDFVKESRLPSRKLNPDSVVDKAVKQWREDNPEAAAKFDEEKVESKEEMMEKLKQAEFDIIDDIDLGRTAGDYSSLIRKVERELRGTPLSVYIDSDYDGTDLVVQWDTSIERKELLELLDDVYDLVEKNSDFVEEGNSDISEGVYRIRIDHPDYRDASLRMAKDHEQSGSYMSRQNLREMSDMADFIVDDIGSEDLDDWVEDKISQSYSKLNDVARYRGYRDDYSHDEDDVETFRFADDEIIDDLD